MIQDQHQLLTPRGFHMTPHQIASALAHYKSKFFYASTDAINAHRVHISATHTNTPFYVIDILDVLEDDAMIIDFKFCNQEGCIVSHTTETVANIEKVIQNVESDIRHSFGIY